MKDDTRKTAKDAQTEKAKKAFACQLKSARERTGKTQSQFFQLIHKGKTPGDDILTHDASSLGNNISYNQYEIAKNFPSLPELRRLAYYCNVSSDELLGMHDAKFFCRLIKEIYPDTSLITTDLPLASGEWPNDTEHKLQIKVTTDRGKEYFPSIEELESIRKNCWDSYQRDLARQIALYLRGELFKARMLSEEFSFSKEHLVFLKMLTFLALNETLQTPVIERTQTASIAFKIFCNNLKSNSNVYQGCFQGSIDNAICFYLMTNINPASAGNRIPALFKFYGLRMMYSKEFLPRGVSSTAFEQAVSELSKEDILLKKLFFDNDNLSYFKDNNPFNNEFYRFLLSRIKDFINDDSTQNKESVTDDSIVVENARYTLETHVNTKKLFLDKLVSKGRYWEQGEWKAFTDYCPAFFADKHFPETADEMKRKLKMELFGAKPVKPQTKQPSGLQISQERHDRSGVTAR